MLDPARFPIASAYLERLPNGLASYPQCRCTANNVIAARDASPAVFRADGIDASLRRTILELRNPSLWVPDVLNVLSHLMVRDHDFDSDEGYLVWHQTQIGKLLETSAHRVLMFAIPPRLVMTLVTTAFNRIRRGTSLSTRRTPDGLEILLRHEADIYPEIILRGMAVIWREAILHANGKNVRVDLVRRTATETCFQAHWD
jgi:hypothetical protein